MMALVRLRIGKVVILHVTPLPGDRWADANLEKHLQGWVLSFGEPTVDSSAEKM